MDLRGAQLHFAHWAVRELRSGASASAGWGSGSAHRPRSPAPKGQEHGELIARSGWRYQVGLIDEFQDTDPLASGASCASSFSCPGPSLLVMVGDSERGDLTASAGGGFWGTYQVRCRPLHREGWSPCSRTFVLNGFGGRASKPADGARPGCARACACRPVVAQRSGGLQLTLAPGTPPLQLLWLGGGIAQRAGAGAAEQIGRACLEFTGNGHRGAPRGGPAGAPAAEDIACLVSPPHPRPNCCARPSSKTGLASRLGEQGRSVPERKEQRAATVCLMSLPNGQRTVGGACWPLAPAGLGAPKNDRPGTAQRLGSRLASGWFRLSAIATTAGLLAALGELNQLPVWSLAESARGQAPSPTLQQGAEAWSKNGMHQGAPERPPLPPDWLRATAAHPPLSPPQTTNPTRPPQVQSAWPS